MDAHIVYLLWAFILGGIAAVSLPLGSLVGVLVKPNRRIIGALSAFGGGALIAALSLELVAPTVTALVAESTPDERGEHVMAFAALVACSVMGGMLFVLLDQIVNAKGGFLRKYATTIEYLTHQRNRRYSEIIDAFGDIEAFHSLTPDSIHDLVSNI